MTMYALLSRRGVGEKGEVLFFCWGGGEGVVFCSVGGRDGLCLGPEKKVEMVWPLVGSFLAYTLLCLLGVCLLERRMAGEAQGRRQTILFVDGGRQQGQGENGSRRTGKPPNKGACFQ
jgi:hypothetical protein